MVSDPLPTAMIANIETHQSTNRCQCSPFFAALLARFLGAMAITRSNGSKCKCRNRACQNLKRYATEAAEGNKMKEHECGRGHQQFNNVAFRASNHVQRVQYSTHVGNPRSTRYIISTHSVGTVRTCEVVMFHFQWTILH